MGNSTFIGSFRKNFKKIQHLAFKDKVKHIKSFVPVKVKLFIEQNLVEELKYFQKKYTFKVEVLSDEKLIIPEYKIDLLNKSKKILETIENINTFQIKKISNTKDKTKKEIKKEKKEPKQTKTKKKLRTLWMRRKKKKLN